MDVGKTYNEQNSFPLDSPFLQDTQRELALDGRTTCCESRYCDGNRSLLQGKNDGISDHGEMNRDDLIQLSLIYSPAHEDKKARGV